MNSGIDSNNKSIYYSQLCNLLRQRIVQLTKTEIAQRKRFASWQDEAAARNEAEIEQRAFWIRNKLCRHCGGHFEGWFSKKCTQCGRSKDY